MKEGKIVPNEITAGLIIDAIKAKPQERLFVVEGFPRTIEQGEMVEQRLHPAEFVICLECSEEEMERRILARAGSAQAVRGDDNIETVRKRFQVRFLLWIVVVAVVVLPANYVVSC